jgi:para-aminobenzoate synthetase/4-amino-4-deoxychorismate lyase
MQINFKALQALSKRPGSFVLLDSAVPAGKNSRSYLFTNPVKIITAKTYKELHNFLRDIDEYSKKYWLCGYLSYEAGYAFEEKFNGFKKKINTASMPLGWFGLFKKPCIFNSGKLNFTTKASALPALTHGLDRDNYYNKINEIKRFIAKGDTYQVNFTYDINVSSSLSPFDLYTNLRKNQPAPYCAYLKNEYGHILSFSPELIFSVNKNKIITKPMKGTAMRGYWNEEDKKILEALKKDNKNNAENIMIVDLLRNDLGRVCEQGSVSARKLFEIETYPTLHQMTSTVSGILAQGTKVSDIIKNLFPCGSVTGAPKIRTMEIINKLEEGTRGVYCGMLGFISPKKQAVFSVPIRILQKTNSGKKWKYRVGSGIVWSSDKKQERDECITKTSFLNSGSANDFKIFESILWDGEKFTYLDFHASRMEASAKYFNLKFNKNDFFKALEELKIKLKRAPAKARIFLEKAGEFSTDHSLIKAQDISKTPKIIISDKLVNKNNVFLYHKTTFKPWYAEASKQIKKTSCFDVIYKNDEGQVTEGSRTNIFIKKNGKLYTPPIACGLLPGVLRKHLLKRGKVKEKILYEKDLINAKEIFCGNSVRGLVKVELLRQKPKAH